jgi:hypothetical protein
MSLEIYGNGLVKLGGINSISFARGPFAENSPNVTVDYTLAANTNAMSAGPITIDNNVTVTISDGSEWTVV